MNSVVSEKGQTTIPKALRDKLGIGPGCVLKFTAENGRLVAEKVLANDPVQKWVGTGSLPLGESGDDYLRHVRER